MSTVILILLIFIIMFGGFAWQRKLMANDDGNDSWIVIPLSIFFIKHLIGEMWREGYDGFVEFYEDSDTPKRVLLPILVGYAFFIGLIFYYLIAILFDGNNINDYKILATNLLVIFILIHTTALKSYLGPLFSAITLGGGVYLYFKKGEFIILNFLAPFFDWIFAGFPDGASDTYTIVLAIFVIGGSIIDSFESSWIDNLF